MSGEDEIGVDTTAAEQSGAEVESLAQRYVRIGTDFQVEMRILSEASAEMPVVTGSLDYSADVVGQLTLLQVHTGALGANAAAGGGAARQADNEIGTGLGTVFAS